MNSSVKIIFHIDMNAYFASVEMIKSPFLRGKPFIVSNRVSNKGIVSTASYEARKYGIHSAMSKMDALKLCPNLIVVDHDFKAYQEYSRRFMEIFREYTSIVEQASIDEAYLDMTNASKERFPLDIAKEIQMRLKNELNLPCSIGIAPTMFLAKMGSDLKKPMGLTVVRKKDVPKLLYPLPIGDFFGIGKKSVPYFESIGIYKIGDIVSYDENELREKIGENQFNYIMKCLKGKSDDIVNPNRYAKSMSIGNSHTLDRETNNETILKKELRILAERVSKRLMFEHMIGKTISIQIKYSNFSNTTRSISINNYIQDADSIYDYAEDLFDKYCNIDTMTVRLLGVTVSNLISEKSLRKEINLFNVQELDKEQKLIDTLKNVKEKYGEDSVKKGT